MKADGGEKIRIIDKEENLIDPCEQERCDRQICIDDMSAVYSPERDDEAAGPGGAGGISRGRPVPFRDGDSIKIPGTENRIKNFRIGIIGEPGNIKKIYFVKHGDGNLDYFNTTELNREAMAAHLKPARCNYCIPCKPFKPAGGICRGRNGHAIINAYRYLERMTEIQM